MSRADELRVPPVPRLGAALREAATDFFFNSWRLVPANVVWGAGLVALVVLVLASPIAIVLLPVLSIPVAGIYRMAALIARGDPVALSDAFGAYRSLLLPALGMGAAVSLGGIVLGVNLVSGIATGPPLGWFIATVAAWSLVFLAVATLVVWPLLADPRRSGEPIRGRLQLAFLVMFTYPRRITACALISLALLAVSTVLFAALLTISLAFVALLSSRVVLAAADHLEGRATLTVPA